MNKIASVTYIPPCWCHGKKGYDIEKGCFIDPPQKPIYVRFRGRRRQAKRWLWLWKVVAEVQEERSLKNE